MTPENWFENLNAEAVEGVEKKYNAPGFIKELKTQIQKSESKKDY